MYRWRPRGFLSCAVHADLAVCQETPMKRELLHCFRSSPSDTGSSLMFSPGKLHLAQGGSTPSDLWGQQL
jgi:hypothetical protein